VGTCNLECSKESKLLSKMESNYSEKVAVLLTGMESKKT